MALIRRQTGRRRSIGPGRTGRGLVAAMLAAMLCCAAPYDGAHAAKAVATAISLTEDGKNTVLAISLSRPAKFRVITLPKPYRVVIDLTQVALQLPEDAGTETAGIVTAYRHGQFAEGQSRIVIDTIGPARVVSSALEGGNSAARLKVVLASTDARAFGKVYRKRKRRETIKQQDEAAWEAVTQPTGPKKGGKKVIVIDPGHGGVDGGASAPARNGAKAGTREKNVVLQFSHGLRKALERTGRYVVHMSRRTDVFVPLRDRSAFARRHNADLFVSIHADSVGDKAYAKLAGTTVYTLSDDGSDDAAREFAARENTSDVIAGVELPEQSDAVANILVELAQRETNGRSEAFAKVVLGQLGKVTKLSRGAHRSAAFRVLKAPDIPSLLIELGYLSNPGDEKRLQSAKWRDSVAAALTTSIARYFEQQTSARPY